LITTEKMKIRKVGWTSFLLSGDSITLLTDPLKLLEVRGNFPKTKTDICLLTNYDKKIKKSIVKDNKLEKKIVEDNRESIMEISIPGEYEVGGLMIRRGIGEDYFIIDEGTLRVVYMGDTDNTFEPKDLSELGDVDVLIVPVGNGVKFMDFDKLEKVLSDTDPAILIPCVYKGEEGKDTDNLKSKEEFIKHFGFANVRDENYLNVDKKKVEKDQQSVEVVFLQ
jgi:L-ascorbate metabolism protein UlaG (beta-lactamase superfamily)